MSRSKKETKFLESGVLTQRAMLAYINNELDDQERQQFEKLLKDDPFAREALEGLQGAPSKPAVSAALGNLNKKVRSRTGLREKKTINIHWSNYLWAAVLLGLLVGIGFVMINFLGKQNEHIAQTETQNPTPGLFDEPKPEQKFEQAASAPADSAASVSYSDTATFAGSGFAVTIPDNNQTNQNANKPAADGKKGKEEVIPMTNASGAASLERSNNSEAPAPSYQMNSTLTADDISTARGVTITQAKAEKKKTKATDTITADYSAKELNTVVRGSIVEKDEADKTVVITLDEAMRNFNSGNYKNSASQFAEILQHQPNNADALYFGAISDYINGNNKRSEKNFDKLLKDGTKYLDGSKWYKANILLNKGKRDEAKKLLDELSQSGGSYKERAVKKLSEMEY